MPKRARCGECQSDVVATSARAVVRGGGVVLICPKCQGEKASAKTAVASSRRPMRSALLSAAIVMPPSPQSTRSSREASREASRAGSTRAKRVPLPEELMIGDGGDDSADEADYDAIYVSIEAEEPSDVFPAYELDAELPPLPHESQDAQNTQGLASDGRDYASASGAIEVSSSQGPRADTTPPPAVVVGD